MKRIIPYHVMDLLVDDIHWCFCIEGLEIADYSKGMNKEAELSELNTLALLHTFSSMNVCRVDRSELLF